MGTQGEIYVILGKRFPVERVDPDPELDDDPNKLLYRLNQKIISITEDKPRNEYDFYDCLFFTPRNNEEFDNLKLGIKILNVDHEYGDRNLEGKIEGLVGYSVANESYATCATPLPTMDKIASLRPRLAQDIKNQFGLDVTLNELELHLLFGF